MTKLTNLELWAVAAKVIDAQGDEVGDFLVERINSLSNAGDDDGVATWLAIADRVQQLFFDKPEDPRELN